MIVRVTVQEKITYGFENALNDSRDDFHEDGHATRIRLLARHIGLALPESRSFTGRR